MLKPDCSSPSAQRSCDEFHQFPQSHLAFSYPPHSKTDLPHSEAIEPLRKYEFSNNDLSCSPASSSHSANLHPITPPSTPSNQQLLPYLRSTSSPSASGQSIESHQANRDLLYKHDEAIYYHHHHHLHSSSSSTGKYLANTTSDPYSVYSTHPQQPTVAHHQPHLYYPFSKPVGNFPSATISPNPNHQQPYQSSSYLQSAPGFTTVQQLDTDVDPKELDQYLDQAQQIKRNQQQNQHHHHNQHQSCFTYTSRSPSAADPLMELQPAAVVSNVAFDDKNQFGQPGSPASSTEPTAGQSTVFYTQDTHHLPYHQYSMANNNNWSATYPNN